MSSLSAIFEYPKSLIAPYATSTFPTKMERRSPQDYLLQPAFTLLRSLSSFTIVRLYVALVFLLPAYVFFKSLSVLFGVAKRAPMLLTPGGRQQLIRQADMYRDRESKIAFHQFRGHFQLYETQVYPADPASIKKAADWQWRTEELDICGAKARVTIAPPDNAGMSNGDRGGETIVLLHGNPSWSYMWRDVIPNLTAAGHTVFALDLLGHGLSDKPTSPILLTVDLHARTLATLFAQYNLSNAVLVAHDWGGCIASVTALNLPPNVCRRIVYLNSFLPPRGYDISFNAFSLYLIWYLSTGILNGLLPESLIMRYMSPSITASELRGYSAPYARAPRKAKISLTRFSHIIPGLPDLFLEDVRALPLWRILEGLVGPEKFTNINQQARLAEANKGVRDYWRHASEEGWKVGVLFGTDDPLLADFKRVWEKTVDPEALVEMPGKGWLNGAGHYPTEERSKDVSDIIQWFVEETREKDDRGRDGERLVKEDMARRKQEAQDGNKKREEEENRRRQEHHENLRRQEEAKRKEDQKRKQEEKKRKEEAERQEQERRKQEEARKRQEEARIREESKRQQELARQELEKSKEGQQPLETDISGQKHKPKSSERRGTDPGVEADASIHAKGGLSTTNPGEEGKSFADVMKK